MSEPHISNLGFWQNGERLIPCRYASQYNCRRTLNLGNMSGTDNSSLPGEQLAAAMRIAIAERGGTLVFGESLNDPGWVCPDHYHQCYHCSRSQTGSAQDMLDAGWRRSRNELTFGEWDGDWECEECLIQMGITAPSPAPSAPSTPERNRSERSAPPSLRRRREPTVEDENLAEELSLSPRFLQERREARDTSNRRALRAIQRDFTNVGPDRLPGARSESQEARASLTDSSDEEDLFSEVRYMTRLQRRNAENERIVREAEEDSRIQYKLQQVATLSNKIQTAKQQPINTRLADDTKTIYDVIMLEDITIANLLKDKDEEGNNIPLDELNIVFQQDKEPFNAIAISKKTLEDMVYNPSYLNQTKYECYFHSEALAFDENELVFNQDKPDDRHNYTFINSRALGLVAGMFIRSQLKEIVDNLNNQRNSPRYFMYHITNMTVAPIIAADKVGWKTPPSSWTHYELPQWERNFSEAHTETGSMVSADHCQSLDHNYIIAIQPVRNLRKRQRKSYNESSRKRKKTKKGGKRNRRRKKTRKKRKKGGMEPPPTPIRHPHDFDNDQGTNPYHPGDQPPPLQLAQRNMRIPTNTRTRRRRRRSDFTNERPRNAIPPSQEEIDQVNRMQQRYNRHPIRNAAGDILEFCIGSRCGLGGGKKSHKTKKTLKKRRKKKRKNKKKTKKRKN